MYARRSKPLSSARRPTAATLVSMRSAQRAVATRQMRQRRAPAPAAQYSARAAELKSVDTSAGLYAFNSAGAVAAAPLNVPVSGAAFYQRVGNKISMKSLQLRGEILPSGANAAAVSEQTARIIVYYDRQANGAAPTVADVLTSTLSNGTTASTAIDFININNRDRFLILMDQQVLLSALGINGATAASSATVAIDINNNANGTQGQFNINRFIKLKGLETVFKASAGNIGDISAGAIGVLTISTGDVNATSAWQLIMSSRLRYYDY